jgi:CheY-like chemotaxis protein
MPIVLAIEPDLRQAAIIKRIVRDKIHADVVVVDSRDAALDAIRTSIPDVLLLSALLSPRDEDELIAHLRLLDGAEHLQTHTIPQLAGTSADREAGRGRGLLGMFSRKKDPEPAAASGCDPDLFAEEIRTYLQHAHEKKEERRLLAEQGIEIETPGSVAQAAAAAAAAPVETTPEEDTGSAWSDPFAWRPASSKKSPESRVLSSESAPAPPKPRSGEGGSHESVILNPEAVVASQESVGGSSEPVVEHYESVLRPESAVTTPAPVIINPEPIIAAPASADPWAVDYSHRELGADAESTMVGYTAPFSTPPAESVSLVDSAVPAFQPLVDEPAISSYDETSRVARDLDLRLDEDSATPLVSEDLRLNADEPVHEIGESEDIEELEGSAEPEIEEEPVMVAPRRAPRSRRAAQSSLLRLMPLAIWARAELDKQPRRGAAMTDAPERSVNDELRDLMSRLAVPPNVAGVTYPRGCRIRRVRVPGGRERRQGETPGPVILSKRALENQRSQSNA